MPPRSRKAKRGFLDAIAVDNPPAQPTTSQTPALASRAETPAKSDDGNGWETHSEADQSVPEPDYDYDQAIQNEGEAIMDSMVRLARNLADGFHKLRSPAFNDRLELIFSHERFRNELGNVAADLLESVETISYIQDQCGLVELTKARDVSIVAALSPYADRPSMRHASAPPIPRLVTPAFTVGGPTPTHSRWGSVPPPPQTPVRPPSAAPAQTPRPVTTIQEDEEMAPIPTATSVPPPPPSVPPASLQGSATPLPQPPTQTSWAAVTGTRKPRASKPPAIPASKPTATKATPAKSSPTARPGTKHNRVIIHVGRKGTYKERFAGDAALVQASTAINRELDRIGNPARCLGVRRSSFGNLLVSFPTNTSRKAVISTLDPIRAALLLPGDPSVPGAYIRISIDCNWTFLSIANVPTKPLGGALSPYSMPSLLAELRANPAFKDLAYTRLPDWVSDPSKLTKQRSSIAFAFEDPSGTLADRLRREDVFMFGMSVTVKSWSPNKPNAAKRGAAAS